MAFQTWLATVLKAAGLTVVEEPGWRTRSADEDDDASTYSPRGVIIHETRGSATSTDGAEIGVLINGRVGLSGPIAQLYLSRTGVWHVVAAGLCHHVRTGWGGPFEGLGNTKLLGIEAQHGEAEDWANKPVQYAAYVKGVAAIVRHTGWPPPVGHKEHQPGDKPDPEFNMDTFRADVKRAMMGAIVTELTSTDKLFLIETAYRASAILFDYDTTGPWTDPRDGKTVRDEPNKLKLRLNRQDASLAAITAALTRLEAAESAQTAAIKALAEVGGADVAPVLAAIDKVKAELGGQLADAATKIAALQADLDSSQARERQLQQQLAAAHATAAAQ